MKYNCSNPFCTRNTHKKNGYCIRCHNIIEDHYIKAFKLYLSERFLFKDDYNNYYPFKIVETQHLKHGIRVSGYSTSFLRILNADHSDELCFEEVIKSIKKLKEKNNKLYEALKHLWGKELKSYNCHHSTLYRRLNKAIKFLILETGLLPAQ